MICLVLSRLFSEIEIIMQFSNSSAIKSLITKVSPLLLTMGLVACGGGTETATNTPATTAPVTNTTTPANTTASPTGSPAPVKLVLNEKLNLVGAGATFPAPLYQRWASEMSQALPNLQIDYQSVGSGAGVERFTQGLVNFGASDVAMKDDEITKVSKGVLMLPVTAGSIVLAYNVPNVPELKLSRANYVDIFLGKITNWNDPKIAADNPGVTFPDLPINVVFRSDGSGTTGFFTKHLSAISPEWQQQVGEGKTVEWPVGIGAKGNEGVTAGIKQTPGAIGYVEYGYAKTSNLTGASLQNKAGQFIKSNDTSASATLAAVTLPENLREFITDPDGAESYPIVTYSWILANKQYDNPKIGEAVEAFVEYALNQGQNISGELGYVPLPPAVRKQVATVADQISPEYKIEVK